MNNPVMNICKPTFVFWWVFKSRSWLSIRNTRIPYDASKTVKFLVTMYIMVTISVYADTTTAIFVVFSWGDLRTCGCNETWVSYFKRFYGLIMGNVNCAKKISYAVISHQKGLIILPTAGGVLADFWVPNEIDSLNFQRMLLFRFH